MASDARFVMEMKAEADRFGADLGRAEAMVRRSATSMQTSFAGLAGSIGGALRGIASFQTMIVGVAGAGGLGLLIGRTLSSMDALDEMASRLGFGVESLQELQHAARLTGASVEDLETGLRNLNRRAAEAASGQKEAADLFRGMGIAVTDAGGQIRTTDDILGDFADRIAATASPAERTRLAMEAFGRSGTQLLPMLERGRAGLSEYREEARRLGLVIDEDMIKKAGRAQDQISTLATVIGTNLMASIGQVVASDEFANWIKRIGDGIADLVKGAKDLGLLPTTTAERVGQLTGRIRALREEADKIARGATIGDRLNRFFGQAETDRERARALDAELESLVDFTLAKPGTLAPSTTVRAIPEREMAEWARHVKDVEQTMAAFVRLDADKVVKGYADAAKEADQVWAEWGKHVESVNAVMVAFVRTGADAVVAGHRDEAKRVQGSGRPGGATSRA